MKSANFAFHSQWEIAAPSEVVWKFLATPPFQWDQWWPELKDLRIIEQPEGLRNTVFSCRWQSPLGYKLFTRVCISEIDELQRVRFEVKGSLRGTVECRMHPSGSSTRITINWQVQTTKTWMNLISPLMRPLFVWAHHAVMRSGERSLQRELRAKQKSSV